MEGCMIKSMPTPIPLHHVQEGRGRARPELPGNAEAAADWKQDVLSSSQAGGSTGTVYGRCLISECDNVLSKVLQPLEGYPWSPYNGKHH